MKWAMGAVALAVPVCLFAVEHDETYQKTFTLSGSGERRLILENIQGNIHVTGDSGNDIRITVHEHWSANSAEMLAHGRNDVKVEMVQTGNVVKVSLEGPFREHQRNSWYEHHHHDDFHFRHDYEVLAPRAIDLALKTVNGRELTVSNVEGDMTLNNINGAVTMQNVAGSAAVKTINGKVKGNFVRNPVKPCSFETLNGTVDIAFQPGLSADMQMETMHGDAFTDFEFTAAPTPVSLDRSFDGHRFRIRSGGTIRIGSGGVVHRFKTMNGSIMIRKDGK